MDLNSYLTEFFSLINNNNSIFGGNGYMRGGKKPDGVNFDESLTNDQILEYYFDKPDPTFKPSVDNSDKLKFRSDTLKKEFIEHQVGIVEYMLDRNQTKYGGGMYGGGELEDAMAELVAEQSKSTPDTTKIQDLTQKIADLQAKALNPAAALSAVTADPSAGTPTLTLETSFIEYMKTKDNQYNPTKILVDNSTKEDFKPEFDVLPKKSKSK